jgi:type IV pilus assembly protein PilV
MRREIKKRRILMSQFRAIQGMTLVEVTIALFLLAIGLLGLAGLQMVTLRADHLGQQATLATTLAKAKLAELQENGSLTEGEDQYIDKANGKTYTRQWSVSLVKPAVTLCSEPASADTADEATHSVVVRVSWSDTLTDRCVTVSAINPSKG